LLLLLYMYFLNALLYCCYIIFLMPWVITNPGLKKDKNVKYKCTQRGV
jgi:hypothetical protein